MKMRAMPPACPGAAEVGAGETAIEHLFCLSGLRDSWIPRPRNQYSPLHQREHTPAQVFTRVGSVTLGFRGQLGSNLFGQLVVGVETGTQLVSGVVRHVATFAAQRVE